eukprot:s2340_g23.t1
MSWLPFSGPRDGEEPEDGQQAKVSADEIRFEPTKFNETVIGRFGLRRAWIKGTALAYVIERYCRWPKEWFYA